MLVCDWPSLQSRNVQHFMKSVGQRRPQTRLKSHIQQQCSWDDRHAKLRCTLASVRLWSECSEQNAVVFFRTPLPTSCCMQKRSPSIRRECSATTGRYRKWRLWVSRRWTLTWPRSREWVKKNGSAPHKPAITCKPCFIISLDVQ